MKNSTATAKATYLAAQAIGFSVIATILAIAAITRFIVRSISKPTAVVNAASLAVIFEPLPEEQSEPPINTPKIVAKLRLVDAPTAIIGSVPTRKKRPAPTLADLIESEYVFGKRLTN
jgi:hypothetical protein